MLTGVEEQMNFHLFKFLKQFFIGNSISQVEWKSVKREIYNTNKRILSICSTFGSAIFFIFAIIAEIFKSKFVFAHAIVYVFLAAALGIIAVLCRLVSGRKSKYIMILVYAFYFSLFAFSIYSGIFEFPNTFAVVYIVLEFGFPLVFIEKTSRFFIVSFFSGTFFCILSFLTKRFDYAEMDTFYVVSFYCISFMPSFHLAKTRVREFRMRQLIENERDTDELTGLLNKAAFFREARRAIAKSKNEILIIVDLDFFKQINDTYGHFTGDHVLRLVGESIRMNFRKSDILGRFGGDEFVILMDNTASLDFATEKCKQLISILNTTKIFPNDNKNTPTIHASIGISICGESYDIDSLFQKTDEALYNAKKAGKNAVCVM